MKLLTLHTHGYPRASLIKGLLLFLLTNDMSNRQEHEVSGYPFNGSVCEQQILMKAQLMLRDDCYIENIFNT